jgi:hypothetical protein
VAVADRLDAAAHALSQRLPHAFAEGIAIA